MLLLHTFGARNVPFSPTYCSLATAPPKLLCTNRDRLPTLLNLARLSGNSASSDMVSGMSIVCVATQLSAVSKSTSRLTYSFTLRGASSAWPPCMTMALMRTVPMKGMCRMS